MTALTVTVPVEWEWAGGSQLASAVVTVAVMVSDSSRHN